jgi:predicted DCC family thiol-disulfide oxidoreductase YuxK
MDLVFFDGVCGLCDRFVSFLLRHDKKKRLFFAPLQGTTFAKTKAFSLVKEPSLVFIKGQTVFVRSKAVIESLASLGGGWVFVRVFLCVPSCLRDIVYRWIAKHRYQWFGKKDQCRVPTEQEQQQFLE